MKMSDNARRAARTRLLEWFARHRRRLPWRNRRTPYRVWISELMLQQTRVDQALPYYRRFMRRFPGVRALARASRHDVLKAWEGLGYYARARRAHDTARHLVREQGGRFPRTYAGLLALPGIGPYTAAAIGSLAFGLQEPVVDGNVARVLARLMAWPGDVRSAAGRKKIERWARDLLAPARPGDSNEALMELGALCCLPRNPRCDACPLRRFCRARAKGRPERYPARRPRRRLPHKVVGAALVVDRQGRLLIARRFEESMLGGLWEFPGGTRERGETMSGCIRRELQEELGIDVRVGAHFMRVRHAYSHFTIELHVHWAKLEKGRPRPIHCAACRWVRPGDLEKYPFPAADVRIIQALGELKLETGNWRLAAVDRAAP
ncbi:MAG: A/G-specific adenine glycosylase [Kiritimatiellae bacterium]|nr:A/G-specific adenine glycosylase [Kiritimatiellia bacterium]